MKHNKQIAEIDVDEAYAVSSRDDIVYFTVEKNRHGWWMSAMIDCGTASFVDDLVQDDGPFATEDIALQAGLNCAFEWMESNGVTNYEVDLRLKRLMPRKPSRKATRHSAQNQL